MTARAALIEEIVNLHSANEFYKILESLHHIILSDNQSQKTILHCIIWPIPTHRDLEILSGFIHSREISNLFSIGCGTGLLEWLLLQAANKCVPQIQNYETDAANKDNCIDDDSDSKEIQNLENPLTTITREPLLQAPDPATVTLTAVEIDSSWWSSKYAPPVFLPHKYVDENFSTTMPFGSHKDLAIFSYFNNMKAFKDYLKLFQGIYVVIIGPTEKQYCAPSPLDLKNHPDLPTQDWNIILFQRFGLEAVDHIAIYSKADAEDLYF